MKLSTFLTTSVCGLLLTSTVWAGPPEGEVQTTDDTMTEQMEPVQSEEMTATPEIEVEAEPVEILSFEEAVAACAGEVKLQECVDEKTGQVSLQDGAVIEPEPDMDSDMELEPNMPEDDDSEWEPYEAE